MKHLPLLLLINSLLFLVPCASFGADTIPKDKTSNTASGDKDPPASATDQGQNASQDDGDADKPKPRKPGPHPTAMDIVSVRGGSKALSIHFRWSLYPNSSVEVRLVPGPEPKEATVSPIYFSEHLTGKVRDELYACLDHTGEGGHSYTFTKDKMTYKMIGRRNALERQGVHVQARPEEVKKAAAENPAAAFLQLDTWAVNPETLSLELPRDEFPKPGTLFVWFFRGEQVVWEEQARWPGYK